MVRQRRRGDKGFQPPRMPKYSPKRYSVGVDLGKPTTRRP
jgi:hypothetical protein